MAVETGAWSQLESLTNTSNAPYDQHVFPTVWDSGCDVSGFTYRLHGRTILTRLTACRLHLALQVRECLCAPQAQSSRFPVTFFSNQILQVTFKPHNDRVHTMSAIGSLIFCNDCGNLLDGSAGKKNVTLTCAICGATCKGAPVQRSRMLCRSMN
jgi:hypothetical protein